MSSEQYRWIYEFILDGLNEVLGQFNDNMAFADKVTIFADVLQASLNELPDTALSNPAVKSLLKRSYVEVVAIFAVDEFTAQKYHNKDITIKDVYKFLNPTGATPNWMNK